jgi:uncharacterized protein
MAECRTIDLPKYAIGTQHSLKAWHFGTPGARPKVYIQAGIHADELPANLVAARLLPLLQQADAEGMITGEVILVPVANPIGFNNVGLRSFNGRYHLPSGENYNRNFPDVSEAVLAAIDGRMANGREADLATVRAAIARALDNVAPSNEAQALRLELMKMACDADIVLDLHTDSDAEMHLYLDEDHWPEAADLAALLDAKIVMFARASGGGPFEETIAWPYVKVREIYGADAIDLPLTVVVELRGEYDTSHALAQQDAAALLAFLQARGAIKGKAGAPRSPAWPGRFRPRRRCAAPPPASSSSPPGLATWSSRTRCWPRSSTRWPIRKTPLPPRSVRQARAVSSRTPTSALPGPAR